MATVPIGPPVDIYATFSRFNYKAWTALAEFVDNSIQSFVDNRHRLSQPPFVQQALSVYITFDSVKNRVLILDDAAGIPLAEFPRAFRAAVPPSNTSGRNEFGMGMKCAGFWFTHKWSVDTRHIDDNVKRKVTLDLAKIRAEQSTEVPIVEATATEGWHGTNIVLEDVQDRLPRGRTIGKVREFLADIFRVSIESGDLKLLVDGQECTTPHHRVLVAPTFDATSHPVGPAVTWKKSIAIDLPGDRRVTGFAALFAKGDRTNAGFTLFRRNRVVDGFPGNRWMPEKIFGKKNSFESLRIFGDLHFEGFGVSSQKDQLDWSGFEDDFCNELKAQLNLYPVSILQQSRNFRANPIIELPPEGGETELTNAVEKVAESLKHSGEKVHPHPISHEERAPLPAVNPPRVELVITPRKIEVPFEGETWVVEIQFPKRGVPNKWLDVRGGADDLRDEQGNPLLQILIALDHPFSRNFIQMESEYLEPLLRIAAALALAERLAKKAGVQTPSVIRSRMNEVLSQSLGNPAGNDG